MRFVVTIDLGNDAMRTRFDVADALRTIAKKLEGDQQSGKVLDDNGNSVGTFEFLKGEDERRQSLITAACEAEEAFSLDDLEAYAAKVNKETQS